MIIPRLRLKGRACLLPLIYGGILYSNSASLAFAVSNTIGNTIYGTGAGSSITSGDYNTLIGVSAGNAQDSDNYCTIVGYEAGKMNKASEATFIGYMAGAAQTTGFDNTFVGTRAGQAVTTAGDNTLFGTDAGYSLTDGYDSTFIGESAGYSNTTGHENTFIGNYAGRYITTGADNTAVGSDAMSGNSADGSAIGNTAIGYIAMNSITTGIHNTSAGYYAGKDVTTGNFNTLIGHQAGNNVNLASYNTIVGTYAGYYTNSDNGSASSRNTLLGASAGDSLRYGEDNLVVGVDADVQFNSTVSRTVLLGRDAFSSASDSIGVGYSADARASGSICFGAACYGSHGDSVSFGLGVTSRAADTVIMGNGSAPGWEPDSSDLTALGNSNYRFSDVVSETVTTTASSGNSLSWTLAADAAEDSGDSWQVSVADGGALSFSNDISGSQIAKLSLSTNGDMSLAGEVYFNSDASLKQDIQPISNALQKVSAVAAKRYRFTREMDDSEPAHLGVLAQELEQTLPELIDEGDDGIKSVNYIALAPLLTSAMNELAMDNRQRRKQLQVLKARKSSLLKALEQLEREGK